MLRDEHAVSWTFHHNTTRWPFNVLEPDEERRAEPIFKEYPGAPLIALPRARVLGQPIGEIMAQRISCRAFSLSSLTLDALATMLSLAYGVRGEILFGSHQQRERPVPSGGGLYPLELYVIARRVAELTPGIYHYAPLHHGVEQLKLAELSPQFISQLFMNQPYIADAAAIIVFGAVVDRTMYKYGDRGYRYILLEGGHAAQNICLAAISMGLGALPIGGFFDGYLAELLGIDLEEEILLYGMGIGPTDTNASDRVGSRNLAVLLGN